MTMIICTHTYLQGVEHSLACDYDLLGLLLHGQRADQGSHLLCRLPLGQLAQTLLPRPHTGVDDLQEQLASARVEDKYGTVDGLGGQVSFKGLYELHGHMTEL